MFPMKYKLNFYMQWTLDMTGVIYEIDMYLISKFVILSTFIQCLKCVKFKVTFQTYVPRMLL
jgi:hypothetical protein